RVWRTAGTTRLRPGRATAVRPGRGRHRGAFVAGAALVAGVVGRGLRAVHVRQRGRASRAAGVVDQERRVRRTVDVPQGTGDYLGQFDRVRTGGRQAELLT